jgi:hypothetical protein
VTAAGPGEILRFYGNRCVHWTSENTTGATRASLDLRVDVAGDGGERGGAFASGYFARFRRGSDGAWARDEPLPPPDYRMGYPFGGVRSMKQEG